MNLGVTLHIIYLYLCREALDLKLKKCYWKWRGQVHKLKGLIYSNYLNTNALTSAAEYMKKKLIELKEEIDYSTITFGDFKTHCQKWIEQLSRLTRKLKTWITINQLDLPDICRAFHLAIAEHIFFLIVHGIFSKIYHVVGYETSLNKFNKIEIIHRMLSNQNRIKLEINNKRKFWKFTNVEFTTILNSNWVTENQRETRKYSYMNRNENTICQNL